MTDTPKGLSPESHQFARITFSTCLLFLAVGSITSGLSFFYSSPVARGLGILIIAVLLPLSILAHFQVKKDYLDRAVALVTVVWYIIAFGMIIVGDRLYGVLIVTATLPVLMVLPFASQAMFRRLIIGSILLILVGSVTRLTVTFYVSTVPDNVIANVESFSVMILSLVVMLSLWQSGGKLKAAAAGMRKAIVALQESEKSLEIKVEQRTTELEQAFQESSDLNKIATIVNSTLDVDRVQDIIFEGLQKMFTFDQMGVFLVDPADQRLRLAYQRGRSWPEVLDQLLVDEGLPLDAGDSVAAASVVAGESIFMGKITDEGLAQAGPNDRLILKHNPFVSILLCPLTIENRSIGCIFFSARTQAFKLSEKEITAIERYVTQMGTAIRNAQLFKAAEESRHEAETANETKGTFLANMSHEIRTPMNAIIGLTGLCLDTELNSKQKDYLSKVDGAANALRTIIDDILDFSKLEAGKFEFESIPFSLNDVLDNLATICMVRCQNKHLELVFQRDPTLPDLLSGDPTRLGQILINLAGNAIKFTEEGEIVVEVRQAERIGDKVSVRFDVRDSGIGMNEEQLGRLFQSFSQADSTISRQYGGTGLGLAISQQLTEMMGGEIEVTSQPGEGSSFHFELTFDVLERAEEPETREEPPQGLNVLVVDDNEPSRDILQEYLLSFGYSVTLAESGEQALEIMAADATFDVLLLDWMMPGMTGLDVALAVREKKSPPKIVLLSSWDMPSSEHQAIVDAFLAKPVKPSALLDTIMLAYGKQVVQRVRNLGSKTGPEDLVAIRGARVLVVDDSPINLQIACELLQKVPLVLDTASDGGEAVDKVRAADYDCVLMDIQMPGMDGYTATRILREHYPFDDLPILAMTANVMAEDRTRTRDAGMNGHIPKPVDPADLYKALLDAIAAADYSANLSGIEITEKLDEAEAQQAPLPDTLPGLDIRQGLSRLAGNEALFMQLLKDLLNEYAGAADSMRALVAGGGGAELREAAHKVRGIANNLGATDIGASAEIIEKVALAGNAVQEEQIEALADALKITGESLDVLMVLRQASASSTANEIDTAAVFVDLQAAVGAFDPGATSFVDQLIAAQPAGSGIANQLTELRELLDNFNFSDAEPLLAGIQRKLQGPS
ncbi:response regulator [Candidatus Marimicrobium litorale]|uniref:histidine kinase n=1 Tax=Candidatus Marimicrobium litorale TaxID=2518991 RepID=A0ABT3T4F4_9GAMM|nr:response regulator [Candidatus Marimicrobium litorale]MCX2976379.1 response regulator [Candidatus Marimicrobium litorale]